MKTTPLVKDSLLSALSWLDHSLAPTLNALLRKLGTAQLLKLILDCDDISRFTPHHRDIINSDFAQIPKLTDEQKWLNLTPIFLHVGEHCSV